MKPSLVVAIVILVGLAAGFLFLRSRVAAHDTVAELPQRLAKLKQEDRDPKAFLGFCTRDEDALYFVHENGVFYLDYELTTSEKRGHADAFRKAAGDLGYSVLDTTYGQFPVLRVEAGTSETRVAEVGLEFSHRLFGHDRNTRFEFLP